MNNALINTCRTFLVESHEGPRPIREGKFASNKYAGAPFKMDYVKDRSDPDMYDLTLSINKKKIHKITGYKPDMDDLTFGAFIEEMYTYITDIDASKFKSDKDIGDAVEELAGMLNDEGKSPSDSANKWSYSGNIPSS